MAYQKEVLEMDQSTPVEKYLFRVNKNTRLTSFDFILVALNGFWPTGITTKLSMFEVSIL